VSAAIVLRSHRDQQIWQLHHIQDNCNQIGSNVSYSFLVVHFLVETLIII
jgi:hypothetical protein